jgi:hypothetical protein
MIDACNDLIDDDYCNQITLPNPYSEPTPFYA